MKDSNYNAVGVCWLADQREAAAAAAGTTNVMGSCLLTIPAG